MEKRLLNINEASGYLGTPVEDTWILRQRQKNYKIEASVTWLLDNLRFWFSGKSLPKNRGVQMSLYKRTRSRYIYINISYGGKRMRVTSRCENKKDAEKVKLLLLTQLMQGISPTAQAQQPAPTFKEGSGQYLKEMCIGKKAASGREDLCHRDLVPFFGEQRINQITPQLVLKWREQETQRTVRGGKQISPRSVNYNLGYLKRFFTYAIDIKGWAKDNPASKIHPLKENNHRDRILSEHEVKRLLNACEHDWVRRILTFGIETGLRIGEIASLKMGEFHLDYGIPHFKKVREKNKVQTEFPIVSEKLTTVVQEQMPVSRTTDYFFTDEEGNPVTTDKIGRRVRKAATKAGINGFVFHDLRRTFCSRLNWLGCNKMFIEYLMGHTVKGIESRYLVNNLESLCEEMKRMEVRKKENSVTHLSHLEKMEGIPVSVKTAETVAGQMVLETIGPIAQR
jgi:integrase